MSDESQVGQGLESRAGRDVIENEQETDTTGARALDDALDRSSSAGEDAPADAAVGPDADAPATPHDVPHEVRTAADDDAGATADAKHDAALADAGLADAAAPDAPHDAAGPDAAGPDAPADAPAEQRAEGGDEAQPAEAQAAPPKPRHRPDPTLIRAFRAGRPVTGTIAKVIKGGYEIQVGKARGFCPHSQIDLHREDDPERHVGQRYQFRVTQLRRGGEDAVLSRRLVLEEQRAEEAKAVRATLIEGHVLEGRVSGLAAFGAFVDLGAGVMGLVHLSELAHGRVKRVEDVVHVGDRLAVKILRIDEENGRISLSARQAVEDPWQRIEERFAPGQRYPGAVLRRTDFGAFVELAPGIEALAPASELPPAAEGWGTLVEPGTTHEWQVLDLDPRQRRISVTLPGDGGCDPQAIVPEALVSGRVQRIEKYGVFVWLAPGRVGLMPRVWTGADQREDLARRFAIGDAVEVTVVEITDGGRRVRLAKQGVPLASEDTARPPAASIGAEGPSMRPARQERERDRDRDRDRGRDRGYGRERPRDGGRERERHREPGHERERERRPSAEAHTTSSSGSSTFGTSLADKLKAALDRGR